MFHWFVMVIILHLRFDCWVGNIASLDSGLLILDILNFAPVACTYNQIIYPENWRLHFLIVQSFFKSLSFSKSLSDMFPIMWTHAEYLCSAEPYPAT